MSSLVCASGLKVCCVERTALRLLAYTTREKITPIGVLTGPFGRSSPPHQGGGGGGGQACDVVLVTFLKETPMSE